MKKLFKSLFKSSARVDFSTLSKQEQLDTIYKELRKDILNKKDINLRR